MDPVESKTTTTGRAPGADAPNAEPAPRPPDQLAGVSDLARRLERAWQRSDALFGLLAEEAVLFERPIALRHPFLFYLGHLAAFGWNQAGAGALGLPPIDAHFDQLFERGIDPLNEGDAASAAIAAWPAVTEVVAYRDAVRQALRRIRPELEASDDPVARRILHVVLEHEQMHHETLMYILQRLDFDRKVGADRVPAGLLVPGAEVVVPTSCPAGAEADPDRVAIPAGPVRLGADFDEQPFGWCNEFPAQALQVAPFGLDSLPVTVARFDRFVRAGGYRDRRFWDEPAWAWREAQGMEAPIDWSDEGLRTMFGHADRAACGALPVHVSRAEARAFCRWAGARLPTEAELQRAAYRTPDGQEREQPWGAGTPAGAGNFGWRNLGALPVGSSPAGASAWGVQELVGNGWEWTDTPFRPLPGFQPWIRSYPGYSADFFDDQHFVVFGASWATADGLVRRSLRNWYQGLYPYVFSTFRCAW